MASEKQKIAAAAKIYGCKVSELMSYAIYGDAVTIIAPSGQKISYSAKQIAEAYPKPRRRMPAKPKATKNPRKK